MKLSSQGLQRIDAARGGPTRVHIVPEFTSYDELASFDQDIAALEPEIRRFVGRKVRHEAVDDVLQEVWLAAWQALPSFDRRGKFRTWIYGICLHKCHDHYRAQRNESRVVSLEDVTLIDNRPSLEHAMIQTDTVERLLVDLDQTQREVLELYYYAQLTLAEIATILERNLNTVKYQFYRAHSEMLAKGTKEGLL